MPHLDQKQMALSKSAFVTSDAALTSEAVNLLSILMLVSFCPAASLSWPNSSKTRALMKIARAFSGRYTGRPVNTFKAWSNSDLGRHVSQ